MPDRGHAHRCRLCGAASYRRVIARDAGGAMRASALYQCSGCSVVFTDPKAWRLGEPAPAGAARGLQGAQDVQGVQGVQHSPHSPAPAAPDFSTYGLVPPHGDLAG